MLTVSHIYINNIQLNNGYYDDKTATLQTIHVTSIRHIDDANVLFKNKFS
jgi:hypothetical protein